VSALLNNFHFLRPEWLLALLPCALLLYALWRLARAGQGWQQVIAGDLLPHLLQHQGIAQARSPMAWVGVGWLVAVISLAGPSWEQLPQPVERREDALIILYDMSYSMLAQDQQPSRLDRAQRKLIDLLEQRNEGLTGLVAYAGDAHVVSPLTDDNRTIANLLPALSPSMMPLPGSSPATAVEQALGLFQAAGMTRGRLLLVSDGLRDRDVEQINTLLEKTNISLSTIGIGTQTGGPIPMPGQGFLKDSSGNIVIPGLQRGQLQAVSLANSGRYADLSLDDSDLESVLTEPLIADTGGVFAQGRSVDTWHDRGYLLILLLIPLVLGAFRRGWLLMLPLCCIMLPEPAVAMSWEDLWQTRDQQAQRLLEAGDAQAAAKTFQRPDWSGAAHYKAGDYAAAAEKFETGDSADALYNQGNALAQQGDLPGAIAAYQEALSRQPEMEDAQFNKALLEQMQQQQQQQQQSGEGENQDSQDGEQDQDQQQQQSGQQDQSQDQQSQSGQQGQDPQSGQQEQQNPDQQSQSEAQQQDSADSQADEQQQSQQDAQREAEQQAQREQEAEEAARQAQAENGQQAQGEESPAEMAEAAAQEAPLSPEEQARAQALESWLRKIPDDPTGLLRRKFQYESQQRARRGYETDEPVW
jgi:Ca-activated chloride channel family protein